MRQRVFFTQPTLLIMLVVFAACTPAIIEPTQPPGLMDKLPTIEVTVTSSLSLSTYTPTKSPSQTSDQYEIDMTKLSTMPKSYEDLTANPDKYVKAPDPLTDINAFNDWWNKLTLALGDQKNLKPNLAISGMVDYDDGAVILIEPKDRGPLINQPQFFYFESNGRIYPVPILTLIRGKSENWGTFAMILTDPMALNSLMNTRTIQQINLGSKPWSGYSNDVNQMINSGINCADSGNHIRRCFTDFVISK